MRVALATILLGIAGGVNLGCGDDDVDWDEPDAAVSDSDSDGDSDGDGDGDNGGDVDSDGDADVDADGDADGDTDVDADTDADTDTDSDVDGDTDADTDADSDTNPDACDPKTEVLQPGTNLCWLRCALGRNYAGTICTGIAMKVDWCDASGELSNECQTLHSGEDICELELGSAYRLPSRDDYMNMYGNCSYVGPEYQCPACSLSDTCSSMFNPNDVSSYWTSLRNPDLPSLAWVLSFEVGVLSQTYTSEFLKIHCIRPLQ